VPNKHKIPGIRTLQESCPLSYTYSPSNFTTNDRRVFSRQEAHSLAGRNMMVIRSSRMLTLLAYAVYADVCWLRTLRLRTFTLT
jgi:hypothetical protein